MPDPRCGVFETLLILDGRPIELDAHLARLEASLKVLFPHRTPPSLDMPVIDRPWGGSTTGMSNPSSLRIGVVPSATGFETESAVRSVTPGTFLSNSGGKVPSTALATLVHPGGLGAHKWADRSLLDAAQAELPRGTLPLIVDRDGATLEASRANVFAVRDETLLTPPLDGRILPGITRMRVLELAAGLGIEAREVPLATGDLLAADEVFLTGSVRGVERVDSIDGEAVATRSEVTSTLAAELRRLWLGAPVT